MLVLLILIEGRARAVFGDGEQDDDGGMSEEATTDARSDDKQSSTALAADR